MKNLYSRDGKVSIELQRHSECLNLIDDPFASATAAKSTVRWSNFNQVLSTSLTASFFTASQTLTTVTATTGVFAATDVGRLLVWNSNEVAVITAFTSATVVTVDRSQTVASGNCRVMDLIGYQSSTTKFTLVGVIKPSYVTNTDNKVPNLLGYRTVRSTGAYANHYITNPRNVDQKNGFNEYRDFLLTGSVGSNLDVSTTPLLSNRSAENWQVVVITQDGTTVSVYINGTLRSRTVSGIGILGVNCIGFPFHLFADTSVSVDLDTLNTNGVGWSMGKLAFMAAFSRVLSNQEILDLNAMLIYGAGYAISRSGLELMLIAKRDSITNADIVTLPAYTTFDTPRTILPDNSGKNRAIRLYTNKAAWSNLVDEDSGIFIPKNWYDANLSYDGVNNYTKRLLTVNGQGLPTLSM